MVGTKLTELRKTMRALSLEKYFKEIRGNILAGQESGPFWISENIASNYIRCMEDAKEALEDSKFAQALKGICYIYDNLRENHRISGFLFDQGRRLCKIIKQTFENYKNKDDEEFYPEKKRIKYETLIKILELIFTLEYFYTEKDKFDLILKAIW